MPKNDIYIIFAAMNRIKAIILLILNVFIWMLVFIICIPIILLYLLKRIFIHS